MSAFHNRNKYKILTKFVSKKIKSNLRVDSHKGLKVSLLQLLILLMRQVQGGCVKSSLIRVEEEIPTASSLKQQQHLNTSSDTCSKCKIDKVTRLEE